MAGAYTFEAKLVRLINEHLHDTDKTAIAYRLKQSRFYTQFIDILVDSGDRAYYLGIECKSIDKQANDKLYFSSHFSIDRKGEHQITRIADFLNKTQRFGILALELRSGKGQRNEIYLIPFFHLERAFEDGKKYLDFEQIQSCYPCLVKTKGSLNLYSALCDLRQF